MTYPEVERLAQTVRRMGLTIIPEPPQKSFQKMYYRHVTLHVQNQLYRIPVVDEEEEIDKANPVMLLDMVLRECHWYETSEDYLVWANDLGLNASLDPVREIYLSLREITPKLRALLSPDVRSIPDWDAEFNTGMMQALRSYNLNND